MIYRLKFPTATSWGSTDSSEAEFYRVRSAKRNLMRILWIEDKFDLLIENYVEYERELLDLALYQMIYGEFSWSLFRADAIRINRRLQNLLSACRMYLDQIKHDVGELETPEVPLLECLTKKWSDQFDSKIGYRIMEGLRNHAQHRNLPVHHMSYPREWINSDSRCRLAFRIVPSLSVAELKEDPKVKSGIIAELEGVGEYVPVTPLVREYVEGLGIVHEEFRALSKSNVERWESVIRAICNRAVTEFDALKSGVAIVVCNEDGGELESENVFEDPIQYRSNLVRKNQNLSNLSARFVSGYSPSIVREQK